MDHDLPPLPPAAVDGDECSHVPDSDDDVEVKWNSVTHDATFTLDDTLDDTLTAEDHDDGSSIIEAGTKPLAEDWTRRSTDSTTESSDGSGSDRQGVSEHAGDLPLKGKKLSKRERRLLQKQKEAEERALYRKRKLILLSLTFLPLVAASIALAVVMSSQTDSKVSSNLAEAEESMSQETLSSDVPPEPSALVPVVAEEAIIESLSQHEPSATSDIVSTGGGLRSSSPVAAPSSSTGFLDVRPELQLVFESPTPPPTTVAPSYHPSTPLPTYSPTTSSEPTTAQPTTCFESGLICPEDGKRKELCCSGKCEKSKDSGEKVCK